MESRKRQAEGMEPRASMVKIAKNKYCTVPGCPNKQIEGLSMHSLPSIDPWRTLWLMVLKFGERQPKTISVCSAHFSPEDFSDPNAKIRRLKREAIPSRNMP